jgi:esterase/lipase superfamily enzyme
MSPHRLLRLPSEALGRPVHLWCHGWYGTPILVLPSASGMAHEWQLGGAIEALQPFLNAGVFKLYCVESNVSRSWLSDSASPEERLQRHAAYETFLMSELVPWIERDCRTPGIEIMACGVSFGGFLSLNLALRHPERFPRILALSGRYRVWPFLEGITAEGQSEAYFQQPLAYVPNLTGAALQRVQSQLSGVLVVGQGAHEGRCLPETLEMAAVLRERGIAVGLDVWGTDVSHEWVWWRRQLTHHLPALARSLQRTRRLAG